MKAVWRRHPVLLSAFALALAVTLFFALRLAMQAAYWADHRDEAVQPWMTPGYVAHSWQVPPEELFARMGIAPGAGRPRSLLEIAAAEGIPVAELVARTEAAVAAIRAESAGTAP